MTRKTAYMMWKPRPTCLDAAYERQALLNGLVKSPSFKENQLLLEHLNANPRPALRSRDDRRRFPKPL